jgi:hypothetical protein
VVGEGPVLRVTFRALVEGPTRIRFSQAEALDASLGELEVARRGLDLRVVPAGTLPPVEPPELPELPQRPERPEGPRRPPERK